MSRKERLLYQFPISHYCEKSRWNLDAKGLPYEVRDLVPGIHILVVKRLTGKRTVPVLLDRGKAIADSTAIAAHLEQAYPDRPLLPAGEADRARALGKRIEGVLRKQYRLDPEGISAARATLIASFERIELETQSDPERYLVGNALSIADITAASLLGPLVAPPGSPWDSKEGRAQETAAIRELRAELSTRPGWAWVLARYANDRRS